MRYFPGALAISLFMSVAHGAIIGTTGAVVVVPKMDNVNNGFHQNNTEIRVFPEQQNKTLTTAIPVDISQPATTPTAVANNYSPLTLAAGTAVNTWYLHFDNVGAPDSDHAIALSGSITFDTDVLGIITTTQNLDFSDPLLGVSTTIYSTTAGRQLEIAPGLSGTQANDDITLSANRRTVSFDLRTSSNPDDVRFITAAVPEPGSLVLLASGFSWLMGRRGRRRRGR